MLEEKDYKEKKEAMRRLLEQIAEEEGKATEFVQKKSKMTAGCFVQTMVLGCLQTAKASLPDLVQVSGDLGVEITASGLNQRINESGKKLLFKVLSAAIGLRQVKPADPEVLNQFTGLNLIDSSYVALPASLHKEYPGLGSKDATGLKLFVNYDYLHGEINGLEIMTGRASDQKSRLHVDHAREGSLSLFDLGFFKQEIFAEFEQQSAYFISRLQHQTALYWKVGDKTGFDIATLLQQTQSDQIDLNLFLGQKARVPVRLVAQRLPKSVAAQRRRKAKEHAKKDGRRNALSKRQLQLLDWAIFITNVPTALLSIDNILLVYRLRWQIELIFKLWKSHAHLKQIGDWRSARVFCQFYARLIGVLLFHWSFAQQFTLDKRLSPTKSLKLFRYHAAKLIFSIGNGWHLFEAVLQRIDQDILRLAPQEKRLKSPASWQLLASADF